MGDKFFLNTTAPDFNERIGPLMEAMNGESPLPCALICAAYIDKCLMQILDIIFIEKGKTRAALIQPDVGLIGSIQNRANILYLLGHIRKEVFQNIGHICTIRNKFAHSDTPLTFDDVAEYCKELKGWSVAATVSDIPTQMAHAIQRTLDEPRAKFTQVTMNVVSELVSIAVALGNERGNSKGN